MFICTLYINCVKILAEKFYPKMGCYIDNRHALHTVCIDKLLILFSVSLMFVHSLYFMVICKYIVDQHLFDSISAWCWLGEWNNIFSYTIDYSRMCCVMCISESSLRIHIRLFLYNIEFIFYHHWNKFLTL